MPVEALMSFLAGLLSIASSQPAPVGTVSARLHHERAIIRSEVSFQAALNKAGSQFDALENARKDIHHQVNDECAKLSAVHLGHCRLASVVIDPPQRPADGSLEIVRAKARFEVTPR